MASNKQRAVERIERLIVMGADLVACRYERAELARLGRKAWAIDRPHTMDRLRKTEAELAALVDRNLPVGFSLRLNRDANDYDVVPDWELETQTVPEDEVEPEPSLYLPRTTYMAAADGRLIPEDRSAEIAQLAVGQRVRHQVAAPGCGHVTRRVTRIDADGAWAVVVESTVRIMTIDEVR